MNSLSAGGGEQTRRLGGTSCRQAAVVPRRVTGLRKNGRVSPFDPFEPTLFDDAGESPHETAPLEVPAHQQSPTEPEPVTPPGWPEVEVRVSARRRKTSEARWVGGRIIVSLPAHLSGEAREKTIAWLVDRLVAKHPLRSAIGDNELMTRAVALSDRYRIGARPTSVRWVTNHAARWGSCSFHSGEIRLSHRLRAVPEWVLDAVLVHELAHLVHPNHSPAFHELANGYLRHHEAGLFLAGYGLGLAAPQE
jgi:Protein of unknown function DUF45